LDPIWDFPWKVSGKNWNVIISIHTEQKKRFSIDSNAVPMG